MEETLPLCPKDFLKQTVTQWHIHCVAGLWNKYALKLFYPLKFPQKQETKPRWKSEALYLKPKNK